jgi:hypothetical protein
LPNALRCRKNSDAGGAYRNERSRQRAAQVVTKAKIDSAGCGASGSATWVAPANILPFHSGARA